MGRVLAPFGVRGWVRIKTFTEAPDGLLDYSMWWLAMPGGWQASVLAEAEWHANGLVVRFAEIADRTAAEALTGREIAIPRAELPEPDQGEHYWSDLVGCEVVNLQGVLLGTVQGWLETGASHVLVVAGERERLIPWVEDYVVAVALPERRVTVDWGADY